MRVLTIFKIFLSCSYQYVLLFFFQMDDEDSILPHKLQTALEYVLEKRKELASDRGDLPTGTLSVSGSSLNEHKLAVSNNVHFTTNF